MRQGTWDRRSGCRCRRPSSRDRCRPPCPRTAPAPGHPPAARPPTRRPGPVGRPPGARPGPRSRSPGWSPRWRVRDRAPPTPPSRRRPSPSSPAPSPTPIPTPNPAAVLVALFEEGGEGPGAPDGAVVPAPLPPGEVAFPGGKLDPGEGIDGRRAPRGRGGGRPRPGDGHGGRAPDRHADRLVEHPDDPGGGHPGRAADPVPAADEVARVFDVALADLVADDVRAEELWAVPGRPRSGQQAPGSSSQCSSKARPGVRSSRAPAGRVLGRRGACLVLGVGDAAIAARMRRNRPPG